MKMGFDLNLVQEQKLVMTQQMQLSVRLLQMATFELQQYVESELQENPVLEVKYDEEKKVEENRIDYKELIKYLEFDNYSHRNFEKNDEDEVSPLSFVSSKKSLKEFLREQLIEVTGDKETKAICEYIIECINEKGYLDCTVESISEELGCSVENVVSALEVVQAFEPQGIAARDLKECLRLQLCRKGILDKNIYRMVDLFLEDLADNRYGNISRELGIDIKKVQEYGDIIKSLEPKPSRGFYTGDEVKYIVPDAYIHKINDEYHIIMNEEVLPRLAINNVYKEIISQESDKNALEYVREKLNSAMFLIKSIEHRKSTIYRVIERILQLQGEYFENGDQYLKPMTLKDIADSLNMHESTISRAIKEKYVHTKNGTIRIKDLFTSGLNSKSIEEDVSVNIIKNQIKEMIKEEDKLKPLSDQSICDILNSRGMNISRRTVAKYREELNIKSSSKRKRF